MGQGKKRGTPAMQLIWAMLAFVLSAGTAAYAGTQPVPANCDAGVNAALVAFVAGHPGQSADQDNVMVCGTLLRDAYPQHAGHSGHGAHHVFVLTAPTSQGSMLVEVVTNDDLDGPVTGNKGALVIAYGQAYVDGGPIRAGGMEVQAGVHEPHCATHAGADDGWVVVAGKKYPPWSCSTPR